MDSVHHEHELEHGIDAASDLDSDRNAAYLKGLLLAVVNTIPVVDVECYHSKINQTDIEQLEQTVENSKKRNRDLNRWLFEYFRQIGELTDPEETLNEPDDNAIDADRMKKYRQLLLQLKSLKDKSRNLEESTAKQVVEINDTISKFREMLKHRESKLRGTIESTAAKLRAVNGMNLTNETISEIIARIEAAQNDLSTNRATFIRYKSRFRELQLKAPSFGAYGDEIGINDLLRTRTESESLIEQINDKAASLKECREKCTLVKQELSERLKNNELKKEQFNQSTVALDELKRQLYERRIRLSNLKHDYRKLLQTLNELQNSSPLTDNPLLYVDYTKTIQSIKQHQNVINKYKVDLSD